MRMKHNFLKVASFFFLPSLSGPSPRISGQSADIKPKHIQNVYIYCFQYLFYLKHVCNLIDSVKICQSMAENIARFKSFIYRDEAFS